MGRILLKAEDSRADGVVKFDFSDSSSFIFSENYLSEEFDLGSWETGRELSSFEEESFCFAVACYKAEKTALRLIAKAEQNSLGLLSKLERRGFKVSVAKAVVSILMEKKLLDDERYAELWIRSHLSAGKPLSPRGLKISLAKRGIDKFYSQNAIRKVLDPESEFNLLVNFLEKNKRFRGKRTFSLKSQLKYEGFSRDILEQYFDLQ